MIRRGYYSRLKCIDISLKRFLDQGGEQVIELGSGWSTLSLRTTFDESNTNINSNIIWCEVDYPSLINTKKPLMPSSNSNINLIPLDITSEELPEKLLEFLDSDKRTLVVLEAVAMYLPSEELKFILERLKTSFNKLEIVIYDTVLRGRFGQIMKQNLIRAGVNPLGLTKTSLQDWTTFLEGIGFKDLKVQSMLEAYRGGVMSGEERRECEGVEFLDEVEEFQMIMECYCFCEGRDY